MRSEKSKKGSKNNKARENMKLIEEHQRLEQNASTNK